MPRNFAGIIGYSSEEPVVGAQSFMSRFAGGLIGILLATIITSIRFALIMSAVAILSPFVFLSTLVSLYSYFYKQKKHNPITSFLYSLALSIFVTFELVGLPLNVVYTILAAPFLGLYYGKRDGFFQTIKNFGKALFNQPFVTAKLVINVTNKIVGLFKFVTLDNNTFKNFILTKNRRLRGVIHDFIKELIINQRQLDRNADLSSVDYEINGFIDIFPFLHEDRISIVKIMFTYFAIDFIEPILPKKESLELSAEDIVKFTVAEDRLVQDFSSDKDLTELIGKLRDGECIITHVCPTEDNKVLLFKQYKNDGDEWVTVPASHWVFDEKYLKIWVNMSPINPLTRDNIYSPPKYEDKETRYRICKVHTLDGGLVCQELEEKVKLFESRKHNEDAKSIAKQLPSGQNFSFKDTRSAVNGRTSLLGIFSAADDDYASEQKKRENDLTLDFKQS